MSEVQWEKRYWGNGALIQETPIVNSERHGIAKTYFEDGTTLWYETPFINDVRHGVEREYTIEMVYLITICIGSTIILNLISTS